MTEGSEPMTSEAAVVKTPSAGPPPTRGETGLSGDDEISKEVAIKPLLLTTAICLASAVAGHGLIWAAYAWEWNQPGNVNVPWEPVAGISLSSVAIVAFGGFFISSRRARIAITASFLLTFLVMLTFALTIDALAGKTTGEAKELVGDFRNIVGLIVGFYFASEAAVSGLKVFRAGGTDANLADIQQADRDLPPPETKTRTATTPR